MKKQYLFLLIFINVNVFSQTQNANNTSFYNIKNCNHSEDIINAIIKINTFKNYILSQIQCQPQRNITFNYLINDSENYMKLDLSDTKIKENRWELENAKSLYELISNNDLNLKKIVFSKDLTYSYFSIFKYENTSTLDFFSIVKNRYILILTVKNDPLLIEPKGIEEFIRNFIKRCDFDKLN